MCTYMQNINFVPNIYLEFAKILQIYVGTFGSMPEQNNKKRQYQLAENFNVYPVAKNNFTNFSEILQTCFRYF